MEIPKTQYARSGRINIAYQVFGNGPKDIVVVPGWISHLDLGWQNPSYADWLTSLAAIGRVILFDKRGTGLSDRDVGDSTLEERMDDMRAVLDAVGSQRCSIVGASEGGSLSMLFSATYPERVERLVLAGAVVCGHAAPDFPEGAIQGATYDDLLRIVDSSWGEGLTVRYMAPALKDVEAARQMIGQYERSAASPKAARNHTIWMRELDVRPVARSLRLPVLVLQWMNDPLTTPGMGRWLGRNIAGARYVEVPGTEHLFWLGDSAKFLSEIRDFLSDGRAPDDTDRVLATVLFTDIVNSTERATAMGDRAWRDLLDRHFTIIRRELARFRGIELDSAGDGVLASFDGPARAIRCASAIRDAMKPLGLEIRAGIHTGECERIGTKLAGVAVHTGARVMSCAEPGQVWVSGTVHDLVAGSGLSFHDQGARALKGIPGEWRLYALA